jgi:hypothetical protein
MRKMLLGIFSSFMLVVAVPLTAAELKGQVLRGNGAPAPNVTITLTGPENRTEKTNGSGFYRFSKIPAGTYTVAIEDRKEEVTVPPEGTERNYRVK